MNIYNFPVKSGNDYIGGKFMPSSIKGDIFQPIDLDYIVSISPIACDGQSTYFNIFIKIGQPIEISYYSGSFYSYTVYEAGYPEYIVEDLKKERQKLIEAWKNKDTSNNQNNQQQV